MIAPDFPCDIQTDLVYQRDRTDREAEFHQRAIHGIDRNALIQQEPRLIDIRGQNPVRVEPGRVVHDNDRLA
jgi:hypothetical protein